jgi:hypothetical protein
VPEALQIDDGRVESSSAPAEANPIPPRHWWLKRLGLAAGVFVLLLAGVRWWWGWEAERRLQAKIAEYRAAGQPVLLEDFKTPPIPDEENAAYFLRLAAARIPKPPEDEFDDVFYDRRDKPESLAVVGQFVRANEEGFALVHRARLTTAADWQITPAAPLMDTLFPDLTEQRQLAKTTCMAAIYHHRSGDDASALESIRDTLGIARHVARVWPCIFTHLASGAIDMVASTRVELVAPDLHISDPTRPITADVDSAPRAAVQSLIWELLDEKALQDEWLRAVYGERLWQLDLFEGIWTGTLTNMGTTNPVSLAEKVRAFALGPAWKVGALDMLDLQTTYALAGSKSNWPAAKASLPPEPTEFSGAKGLPKMLYSIVMPSIEGAVLTHFRRWAIRRMAATALALRLYELDHRQRPPALADLVPEYLPAVPRDPFDPNEGEIRYLPEAPFPRLYCIGASGVDDGGESGLQRRGTSNVDRRDVPFFLSAERPAWMRRSAPAPASREAPAAPPTSGEAANDGGEVIRGEGQEHE